uniref:Uncharacterized protein n=1 Tax=viral metagenome TaxID=1070528 RepID=A0A6H1ZFU6_9ZZZZ
MVIGRASNLWVGTDSAGVPHGGRYGDVAAFERGANAHGLKLAWSRIWDCFCIYTEPAPGRIVLQELAMTRGRFQPIALTESYLWLILYLWNRCAKGCEGAIHSNLLQMERDYQHALAVEREQEAELIEADVMDAVWLARGHRTAKAFSAPTTGNVQTLSRKARRARRRR